MHDVFYIPNPTLLLSSIYGMLKTEERILGQPDTRPELVALQNGELDLRTMTLGPATPAHLLAPLFGCTLVGTSALSDFLRAS